MPRQRRLTLALASLGLLACGEGPRDEAHTTALSIGPGPGDSGSAAESGTGDKLDTPPDTGAHPAELCPSLHPGEGGGVADYDFSFVWIANSTAGTVSKIDTVTAVEVARYYSSPYEGDGDPSRTAVNRVGDAAVTSRAGGVAKIAAMVDRCDDLDGNGKIDTSTGPDDVRPWGTDECVRWYAELAGGGGDPLNHQGPRPTAWDAGTGDEPCSRLWVGWWHRGQNRGYFRRLSGADGSTLDEVDADGWDASGTGKVWGPYGGAVDASGDFWVLGRGGPLVRIDGTTLEVSRWELPEDTDAYGLALDGFGMPWITGNAGDVSRFDPATETFTTLIVPGKVGGRTLRGLAIDRQGQAWIAANYPCGLVRVDTGAMTLVDDAIALPDCDTPVGVGVDVDGRVWLPDQVANLAFRYDPGTGTVVATEGLDHPYTYSDMTGVGFDLVYNPAG
ncbi:MAG: hypothetical protein K1X88_24045 [Nannocystaceae bacterium]|nr:hypothetical protein [Nannocystaceae bacterium]